MKVVVLTGGSSGIGKATAELFAARGWQVFELSRSGKDGEGITHVRCDVTDEQSVRDAIAEVMQHTDHIDVVLSNAGMGISGAIEYTREEDARRQMDVNFFGAFALTKAVLPQLRKQHNGRIIFTSSVAAVLAVPYQAFYSASKAAINAFALALQNEVRPFGIRVAVVMPGDVATGFTGARIKEQQGEDVYTHARQAVEAMERDEQGGMAPVKMARLIYHVATCRCPRPEYVGGAIYRVFCALDCMLPKRLVNWIEGKMYS